MIPAISALAKRIWNAHYPGIITQGQIDFMLEKAYSPDALRKQMAVGQRILIAMAGEQPMGFLAVAPLSNIDEPLLRGEQPEGGYFLYKYYLAPEVQRQGIGSSLLQTLLTRLPEITHLRLQVARKNSNAWKFYQKQGFVIEQEADFDIGHGYAMNDYVMEKRITKNDV